MVFRMLALSFAAMTLLSGCDSMVDTPTWVNQARLEVHDDVFTDTFETAKLDQNMLRAIGNTYYRYGNGPMTLTMLYDPQSRSNTLSNAQRQGRKLATALKVHGVRDATVTTEAVPQLGHVPQTSITFPALTAKAPESCKTMMPGYGGDVQVPENGNDVPPYLYGCSVESMIAKQVSRPGDLLGRPGHETYADGRRQENVVGTRGYYGNESFPKLEGEQSSDDN